MGVKHDHLPAIAFDLGNTLLPFGVEEAERLIRNLYDLSGALDLRIDRTSFRESYDSMVRIELSLRDATSWESDPGWRARRICEDLAGKGFDVGSLEKNLVETHPMAFSDCLKFPKGSIEVLDELKGMGIRLALLSNAMDGKGIRLSIREHGIEDLLDPIIVSEEEGIAKPDVRIFQKAISGLGVAPSECAYVGDRYVIDVMGSSRAGMHPIYTRQYWTEGEPPSGIEVTATTIRDLGDLLELWGG